ncbi:MAG: Ltp family lipoprotein [Clostridium sp.]|nr:Ltp family lipoprotein [Clostridium sp.]
MEVVGILSLIFGIIGLVSSVWYIGILPCVVGIVLGIIGLTDFLSDKNFATTGLLISILGAVVSIYMFVSDVDSGRLIVLYNNGKVQGVEAASEISDNSALMSSRRNADTEMVINSKETYPAVAGNNAVEKNAAENNTAEVSTQEASKKEEAFSITKSQQNALKSAQSYLNFMPFSYDGLVRQLEFEKYAHEDAVYAADNSGADWNEQALKSAKSYLNNSAFSYAGLIRQLEYEGFTSGQSSYAVDNCGADWYEQAAKSAASYLSFSSFSHDGLIDQLLYEGFTNEEAVYGVTANGY